MLEKVVLGLGSNTGNRYRRIKKTLDYIHFSPNFSILAVSPVYETEPWGFKNQNNFLNCIIISFYRGSPAGLLEDIKTIEKTAGRQKRDKWKEREIDIDVLFFGSKIINSKVLKVPHPHLQHRNFVLKPLSDIVPGLVHPVIKKKVSELLKISNDDGKVFLYKKQLV